MDVSQPCRHSRQALDQGVFGDCWQLSLGKLYLILGGKNAAQLMDVAMYGVVILRHTLLDLVSRPFCPEWQTSSGKEGDLHMHVKHQTCHLCRSSTIIVSCSGF